MCKCEALLKAIDAYLAKADDDLSEALDDAGFAEAKETVEDAAALEDRLTEALEKETKYFKSKAKKTVDLKAFAKVWPEIIEGDDVDKQLAKLFAEDFKRRLKTPTYGTKFRTARLQDFLWAESESTAKRKRTLQPQ